MSHTRQHPRECPLCPAHNKREAIDLHHIKPLEYNGPADGEQIKICPACHDKIHRLEPRLEKGMYVLEDLPFDPPWQPVMRALMEQKRIFKMTGGVAQDARRRISASLTAEELEMAHTVKQLMGASSIEAMIKALVLGAHRRLTGR